MANRKMLAVALAALAVGTPTVIITAPAVAAFAEDSVIASGSWTKKSFNASGSWQIVERDGAQFVVLSSDFRTRNAPDLKIFLSPLDGASLNGKNAIDGSVLIAPLSSARGGQEYEIPEDVDVSSFTSIIIHCEQYSKLWSVAAL